MSERCSRCGEVKPVAIYLEKRSGQRLPVCKECQEEWAESNEEWPK